MVGLKPGKQTRGIVGLAVCRIYRKTLKLYMLAVRTVGYPGSSMLSGSLFASAALSFSTCLKSNKQIPNALDPNKSFFQKGPKPVWPFCSNGRFQRSGALI